MQYVLIDYSSAQKSQRENPPSVKTQNLGFLSGQGGQTALTWVWGLGRSDRPLRAVRPPWGPLAVFRPLVVAWGGQTALCHHSWFLALVFECLALEML